jgi:hypothetical protein
MKYLPMSNEIFSEIATMENEILNEISMSNEIFDEMGAVKNETIEEIPTDEQ